MTGLFDKHVRTCTQSVEDKRKIVTRQQCHRIKDNEVMLSSYTLIHHIIQCSLLSGRPVQLITISTSSSQKHLATLQITHKDYLYTTISISVYSDSFCRHVYNIITTSSSCNISDTQVVTLITTQVRTSRPTVT